MGTPEGAKEALRIVQTGAAKVGLRLNLSKCEVWSRDKKALECFPTEIIRCEEEGFELLGVGIGEKSLCEKILLKRIKKIRESLDRLTIVDDPQTELSLIRSCLGYPRFAFAIRSTPPSLILNATSAFDEMMAKIAEQRFDIAFTEGRRKQWNLPIRMGGVGLPRARDIAPAAFLANVADTIDTVRQIFGDSSIQPADLPGTRECWQAMRHILSEEEPVLPEAVKSFLSEMGLNQVDKDPSDVADMEEFLRKAKPPQEKAQHFLHSIIQQKRLKQSLKVEDEGERGDPTREPPARAMLRKMALLRGDRDTGYANNWLNAVPSEALGLKMSKACFATSLKWITGDTVCPPQDCPEKAATGRQCGGPLDPWGDHAVTCKTGPSVIARHDLVNSTWMASLKTAGFHVRSEVKVDPETNKRAADTYVFNWNKGAPAAHDWKVTHVLRQAASGKHSTDPDWAIRESESSKKSAEKGACAKQGVEFSPLVIDTLGGFGPQAVQAIARVANHCRIMGDEDSSFKKKRLAQKIRFITMKGVATQILRRCGVDPEKVVVDTHPEEDQEEEAQDPTDADFPRSAYGACPTFTHPRGTGRPADRRKPQSWNQSATSRNTGDTPDAYGQPPAWSNYEHGIPPHVLSHRDGCSSHCYSHSQDSQGSQEEVSQSGTESRSHTHTPIHLNRRENCCRPNFSMDPGICDPQGNPLGPRKYSPGSVVTILQFNPVWTEAGRRRLL